MIERSTSETDRPNSTAAVEQAAGGEEQMSGGDESYYVPSGTPEPLELRAPPPTVKRLSRRAIGTIVGVTALVAVAAFGTALTRRPAASNGVASPAQKAPASTTATDAVNNLPEGYDKIRHPLGAPVPGDVSEIARAAGMLEPATAQRASAVPAPGSPSVHPLPTALPASASPEDAENVRRAVHARESAFTFGGASGQAAGTGASPAELLGSLVGSQGTPASGIGSPLPGLSTVPSGRDDDNRQDDKVSFAERDRGARFTLKSTLQEPRSPYTIFAGSVIPAVLVTGLNSDLPGQIEARVSQNVYDTVTGRHLLVPQGTTLIGAYDSRITYGQSRVLMVWTRLIRPDGTSLELEGMPGADLSGYAGMTGDVDRHVLRLLGAVVLGSVIQAGAQAGTSISGLGESSFSDRARQGLGSGVNASSQQIVRKELQVQPTINVAPGERLNVFATRDLVLAPYKP